MGAYAQAKKSKKKTSMRLEEFRDNPRNSGLPPVQRRFSTPLLENFYKAYSRRRSVGEPQEFTI